ncbi:hypothetical protein M409DRAFT_60253 [Zasmidium cellare ATCC 36951]|uniref:DNA 3'-5' helicase n=1 Tax=Zasmidium cellare ATCC 36951 TaxID=1080233 RepID=A0A6A6C426_ZASCE|nr:uncharacterized protein M409DRAFT_60253 [Zasmidium cellare ATCC 36951]KAF2160146.1 hypothetical protein M409DRAFT_60253 [Zasmidium cellare ATCC 36951]
MDNILQGLNAAQRTAVESPAAVLQVLAPPGSGKTKTLTARVAHLIAHRQLLPWNIIVCTFTVKAANEMKERIKSFVGDELAKQLKLGTFHSVALRYLKHYGQHIGLAKDFGIADTSDSKAILKRIIKKLGMSIEPGQALGRISSRKAKGETDSKPEKGPKSVDQQEFLRLFEEYEATLAASNLLDYDDLLLRCRFLLKSHPQCVSNVQAVLIDEFQDTNNIQYELMGLFAQQHNQITIVGDPDQSIYGFRSAEIKNLTRMKKQWPDTITINLEENYRSSGAILHAAQNIIEQDESRPPKKLQATHTFGLRPVLRKLPSAYAEAEWLVSEIKRMRALCGNSIELNDFAVLLRSAALSRAIETALGNTGIPYRMVGGMRFYDREEIKLVVDYLRVIHQPDNSEAVERVINVPSRMIGEATIKKLREEAQSKGVSFWSLILDISQGRRAAPMKLTEPTSKGLASFVNVILGGRKKVEAWSTEPPSVTGLINLVAQKIGLEAHLRRKHTGDETFEARWSNVEELMAQATEITAPGKLNELVESQGLPQIEGFDQTPESNEDVLSVFLANIALTASAEKKAEEDGEKIQQVTISTIHAAKGLEWPVVFIPACYDGSIPHSRADDHDEERRLLYVGMTRAQALLYLSCPIKNTQREETTISAFLTHPGAGRFFEEHGPSLPSSAVASLCTTLRRDCPTETCISETRKTLESDEDNHWPLNGEEVFADSSRWDSSTATTALPGFGTARNIPTVQASSLHQPQSYSTASATMKPGFTSVKERYDDLMEQAQLRKVDKRAEEQKTSEEAPKGRKRQIEGQGTIASFFAKKQRSSAEPSAPSQPSLKNSRPLQAMSASAANKHTPSAPAARPPLPTHKPRSAPLTRKPQKPVDENDASQDRYVFLSSSPRKGDDEPPVPHDDEGEATAKTGDTTPIFRPASTSHATSMTSVTTTRKTLGVRRSLQGWSARKS